MSLSPMRLFHKEDIYGKVVRETALEVVTYIGTQGVALILSLLLEEEFALEDVAVILCLFGFPDTQLALCGVGDVLAHNDVVE